MKATTLEDTILIQAWFAPEIPVSTGPHSYNGLPGAILMVDVDEGQRQIVAKEVKFETIDEALLVEPSKGKKVNREEFKKIEEEKMAEQKAIHGGSGVKMIIRN